jgi:hypothetical protein
LANVTGTLVTPLNVPNADVEEMVSVKPEVVGAGDAANRT